MYLLFLKDNSEKKLARAENALNAIWKSISRLKQMITKTFVTFKNCICIRYISSKKNVEKKKKKKKTVGKKNCGEEKALLILQKSEWQRKKTEAKPPTNYTCPFHHSRITLEVKGEQSLWHFGCIDKFLSDCTHTYWTPLGIFSTQFTRHATLWKYMGHWNYCTRSFQRGQNASLYLKIRNDGTTPQGIVATGTRNTGKRKLSSMRYIKTHFLTAKRQWYMVIYCKFSSTITSEHFSIFHILTLEICLRWGSIPISVLANDQGWEKAPDLDRQLNPDCHRVISFPVDAFYAFWPQCFAPNHLQINIYFCVELNMPVWESKKELENNIAKCSYRNIKYNL